MKKAIIASAIIFASLSSFTQKKYDFVIAPNGKDTIALKEAGKPARVLNDTAFVNFWLETATREYTLREVVSQLLSCVNAKGAIIDRKRWMQLVYTINTQQ